MTNNLNRRFLAVSVFLAALLAWQVSARAQSGPRATSEIVAAAAAADPQLPDGPARSVDPACGQCDRADAPLLHDESPGAKNGRRAARGDCGNPGEMRGSFVDYAKRKRFT